MRILIHALALAFMFASLAFALGVAIVFATSTALDVQARAIIIVVAPLVVCVIAFGVTMWAMDVAESLAVECPDRM